MVNAVNLEDMLRHGRGLETKALSRVSEMFTLENIVGL